MPAPSGDPVQYFAKVEATKIQADKARQQEEAKGLGSLGNIGPRVDPVRDPAWRLEQEQAKELSSSGNFGQRVDPVRDPASRLGDTEYWKDAAESGTSFGSMPESPQDRSFFSPSGYESPRQDNQNFDIGTAVTDWLDRTYSPEVLFNSSRDSDWTVFDNEGKPIIQRSPEDPAISEGLSNRAASMYRRAGLDPHTDPRSQRQFDIRNRVTAFTGATPEDQGSVRGSRFSSAPTVARFGQSAADWWNQGRNVRVPNESSAGWGQLWRDDRAQLGKSDANFAAGRRGNPLGRPDQAFNPFRSAEKGGPGSGPTPLVRQVGERILGPISTGASIFAQGQEGSAVDQAVESAADYVPGLRANPETDIGKRTGEFLARQAGNVRDTFVDALGNIRRGTKTTSTGQAIPSGLSNQSQQKVVSDSGTVNKFGEVVPRLGVQDGDEISFWGGKKETVVDPTKKQNRANDMNIINYVNSSGSVGKLPEGWTVDDAREYIRNRDAGTLQSFNLPNQEVAKIASAGDLSGLGLTNQPATVDLNNVTDYQQPYDNQLQVGNYIKNENTGEVNQLTGAPTPGKLPSEQTIAKDWTYVSTYRPSAQLQSLWSANEAATQRVNREWNQGNPVLGFNLQPGMDAQTRASAAFSDLESKEWAAHQKLTEAQGGNYWAAPGESYNTWGGFPQGTQLNVFNKNN